MQFALAVLFVFAVVTFWVPAHWPVSVFQVGVFILAAITVLHSDLPAVRSAAGKLSVRSLIPFYPILPLSFAVLWGGLQCVAHWTVYPFETYTAIVQWATFLAVYVVALAIFRRIGTEWFRSFMLWFAFAISVLATLQMFTSVDRAFWLFPSVYRGIVGPFPSHNHFAAFVEAILPFAVYEGLRRRTPSLLFCGMAATIYASVIASTSRTGAALATAEVLGVLLLVAVSHRTTGRTLIASVAVMAVFLGVFTAIVGWQRLQDRLLAADPMGVRPEFSISSVHMIAAHPWFGTGLGTWSTAYPSYAVVDVGTFANQAHNDWLQWSADGGIPFGVFMASLFIWCLRPALRTVWGLGVIAVLLHAFVDYPFSRPALGSWYFAVIAMLSSTYE